MGANDWMLGVLMRKGATRDVCENRHGGNPESQKAFKSVQERLTEAQQRVFRAISDRGERGATNDELCAVLGLTPNQVSPRLVELRMAGRIDRHGIRLTRSGCSAAVWRAL